MYMQTVVQTTGSADAIVQIDGTQSIFSKCASHLWTFVFPGSHTVGGVDHCNALCLEHRYATCTGQACLFTYPSASIVTNTEHASASTLKASSTQLLLQCYGICAVCCNVFDSRLVLCKALVCVIWDLGCDGLLAAC